jgi:hypothetical protein
MPDITINADDVDRLAVKLDQIGDQLEPNEKALLLALFKIAGEQIAVHAADAPGKEVSGFEMGGAMRTMNVSYSDIPAGALGQGFRGSFSSQGAASIRNPNIAADTIGIGVGVSW